MMNHFMTDMTLLIITAQCFVTMTHQTHQRKPLHMTSIS